MEHLNCRGEQKRIEIVRLYDIKLILYAKLLNGHTKHSDANETLIDKYYEFKCVLKSNNNITKYITCGSGAGEHLLKLAKIKKTPIFNPLRSEAHTGNGRGGNTSNSIKWNPVAKELYDAIRWLICCWDTVPYGKLLELKQNLEKYYYNEPFLKKIIYVNNVISKDNDGRTLRQMIDEVRQAGNNIRDYEFELINNKLNEEDIKSYF